MLNVYNVLFMIYSFKVREINSSNRFFKIYDIILNVFIYALKNLEIYMPYLQSSCFTIKKTCKDVSI